MVESRLVAEVLGGAQALGRRVRSVFELSQAVEQGLPKSTLRNVARRVFPAPSDQRQMIYRVVPEATFKRRRDRLSAPESERTERLARVVATAEYVWGDQQDARRFLLTPHPALGGKAPLNASMSELGARQVEELLGQIQHGLPS